MGIRLLLIGLFFLVSCDKGPDRINQQLKDIIVKYPFHYSFFPKNFSAPTFDWHDLSIRSEEWELVFIFDGGEKNEFFSRKHSWTPSKNEWEKIKNKSKFKPIKLVIKGISKKEVISKGERFFAISPDLIDAPIFYRSVPLPFPTLSEDRLRMSWKLGRISDYTPPTTMLTGKKVCINCHTASHDGKTFGIEVNTNEQDKYSYVTSKITDKIELLRENIFNWNSSLKTKESYGANLSTISPQGEYVVSAIRSNLFFVDFKDSIDMVSYFQPKNGILGYKKILGSEIIPLKGADNLDYVHYGPHWSPDGKTIAFSRAPFKPDLVKIPPNDPTWVAKSWRTIDEKLGHRFDIYTIPFNGGEGGRAVPLKGASNNGKSNFFPQYSPDGKWIVFTQAAAGFGIRPDADLYIVSSSGGIPRKLNSNGNNAESWHSWSPDGKWLAFVSKSYNSYTQLMLTHIDSSGNDAPPVIVTRFAEEGKAVNMPVFINNEELKYFTTDIE